VHARRSALNAGVVVIGRNEGNRLLRCLQSVARDVAQFVYVDSGSSDGSVAMAQAMGAAVVELKMDIPFTAARARNAGLERLRRAANGLEYVQFVDGDCELADGWMGKSAAFLSTHPEVAAVSGRLRERYPEKSLYNMLCDIEWDAPPGEADGCGGIAMMRIAAFEVAHGFREDLIAGEEPELCVRLRKSGWTIWRLADEMATHDAAMYRFGQWWKRSVRAGYAFAQAADLHGASPERYGVRESRSTWFWALVIPLATGVGLPLWGGWALLLLVAYLVQVARIALRGRRTARENWWHAVFLVLGKFPELVGQVKFAHQRICGGRPRLIEYK